MNTESQVRNMEDKFIENEFNQLKEKNNLLEIMIYIREKLNFCKDFNEKNNYWNLFKNYLDMLSDKVSEKDDSRFWIKKNISNFSKRIENKEKIQMADIVDIEIHKNELSNEYKERYKDELENLNYFNFNKSPIVEYPFEIRAYLCLNKDKYYVTSLFVFDMIKKINSLYKNKGDVKKFMLDLGDEIEDLQKHYKEDFPEYKLTFLKNIHKSLENQIERNEIFGEKKIYLDSDLMSCFYMGEKNIQEVVVSYPKYKYLLSMMKEAENNKDILNKKINYLNGISDSFIESVFYADFPFDPGRYHLTNSCEYLIKRVKYLNESKDLKSDFELFEKEIKIGIEMLKEKGLNYKFLEETLKNFKSKYSKKEKFEISDIYIPKHEERNKFYDYDLVVRKIRNEINKNNNFNLSPVLLGNEDKNNNKSLSRILRYNSLKRKNILPLKNILPPINGANSNPAPLYNNNDNNNKLNNICSAPTNSSGYLDFDEIKKNDDGIYKDSINIIQNAGSKGFYIGGSCLNGQILKDFYPDTRKKFITEKNKKGAFCLPDKIVNKYFDKDNKTGSALIATNYCNFLSSYVVGPDFSSDDNNKIIYEEKLQLLENTFNKMFSQIDKKYGNKGKEINLFFSGISNGIYADDVNKLNYVNAYLLLKCAENYPNITIQTTPKMLDMVNEIQNVLNKNNINNVLKFSNFYDKYSHSLKYKDNNNNKFRRQVFNERLFNKSPSKQHG